ncbi:unnamed protein product [Absidia cylindrospora]
MSALQSNSVDNGDSTDSHTQQMKRYAEDHEKSTIQVKPDGTGIITPSFRPLPNEILARIIDYVLELPNGQLFLRHIYQHTQQRDLYTWTLVNRQFYAIANPLLWQEQLLDGMVQPGHMQRLLDCLAVTQQHSLGHYIRTLSFNDTSCTNDEFLRLMPYIRHLTSLKIENMTFATNLHAITNQSLQHFPRHCPHLTSLTLINIYLSQATIHTIGQHCHQLVDFTLISADGLWFDTFCALSCCPLEKLTLTYDADQFRDDEQRKTTGGILTENMVMDMTRFQDLTHLILKGFATCSLIITQNNNNNNICWPCLNTLELGDGDTIDDTTWIHFMQLHPHLASIELSNAHLTDASLDAMAVYLGDLSSLVFNHVDGISSVGVRRLIRNCTQLVYAGFNACGNIVDTSGYHNLAWHLDRNAMDDIRRAQ